MTHESSLSVGGSKKDFEHTAAQCLKQNSKVWPIFKSRIKMGKRNFEKLHAHSNYMFSKEAKKYKIVTDILTNFPEHLIDGTVEYSIEPVVLEMKHDK